jgi:hypothetical protein
MEPGSPDRHDLAITIGDLERKLDGKADASRHARDDRYNPHRHRRSMA